MELLSLFERAIPIFTALGDPERQKIIKLLAEYKAMTVNEITRHSNLSRPAISHHLKVLRDSKLVIVQRKGIYSHYSLSLDESVTILKKLISAIEACKQQKKQAK